MAKFPDPHRDLCRPGADRGLFLTPEEGARARDRGVPPLFTCSQWEGVEEMSLFTVHD